MTKALLTGIAGQDASYLSELLLSKGYEVHGLIRRNSSHNLNNIEHLKDSLQLHYGDLTTDNELCYLIHSLQPDEVYNLGAQSDVKISFECPQYTAEATAFSVLKILDAIRYFSPKIKFYQASSSEIFGNCPPPQNELSPMNPRSPYGVDKLFGFHAVRVYRESYGLFACNGILFNHESPRRGLNFVTRKITNAVARIYYGLQDKLELGNLGALRDWGHAADYVKAMYLMLQQDKPDDYCIGTGEAHTVREFVEEAFSVVGLDWQKYVVINEKFYRPAEVNYLCVDASKARKVLNWQPQVSFKELVKCMVANDLKLARKEDLYVKS